MVDPRKARQLRALFRRYRGYLDDLASPGDEELPADFAIMGGVQHYLLLAVESVFRNVLVHAYADVDEDRVLQILRGPVTDLDQFVAALRKRFGIELEQ